MPKSESRVVWSSEQGDLRQQSQKPPAVIKSLPPQQQTVYLHRESKGRGGKGVTLLKGLALSDADLTALCKTLKQACGTGGTVKDGLIEIQGEQREKIAEVLRKLEYKVKVAGG
jgi:translation initiation factor 1